MPEIACEACGWLAVTTQPLHHVWAEHVEGCPAVGGAVRHLPELPPLPRLLPPVHTCTHRPVRRVIAVTPSGAKRYAVTCELCGRMLDEPGAGLREGRSAPPRRGGRRGRAG